jgi:hypothetical protein
MVKYDIVQVGTEVHAPSSVYTRMKLLLRGKRLEARETAKYLGLVLKVGRFGAPLKLATALRFYHGLDLELECIELTMSQKTNHLVDEFKSTFSCFF